MRNVPFLFLSILLFSCGGNGNKSEKNQEITDMDSTESVVSTQLLLRHFA